MNQAILKSFQAKADAGLAAIRSAILVFMQGNSSPGDLAAPISELNSLRAGAIEVGMAGFEELAALCQRTLEGLARDIHDKNDAKARTALDLIAQMEASLLVTPLREASFFTEMSELVDESFDNLAPPPPAVDASADDGAEFEIDDETLEIFRSEADELIGNIKQNLAALASDPANHESLWEIRRNAHTFKGAAGIVGLGSASSLAHRVEDVLDRLAERRCDVDPSLVGLLAVAADSLEALSAGSAAELPTSLDDLYAGFDRVLSVGVSGKSALQQASNDGTATGSLAKALPTDRISAVNQPPAPIVRVSLDRLDDLLIISRNLLINRLALTEGFAEYTSGGETQVRQQLEALLETQRRLTAEMQERLLKIRMVRFGTLTTRLSRAVHVTCLEENKKAEITLENTDVEIDTQVIDALIEPMLHLLRNAVVHGIESPETRRLIGKPEKGSIRVKIEADDAQIMLLVSDDGRGISTARLIDKAVQTGVLTSESAQSIDETEALDLIFERGLTTAESLNMNAGRGVGMSIVRESVVSNGGSVEVDSEPQRGTRFTITLPLNLAKTPLELPDLEPQIAAVNGEALPPLVLIVDDSASIRRQTSNILRDAGLRYITANDGAEALELLLSGTWEPDLILSDVEMPQIDGWEFLKYVKTDENLGHIPIVMVTSLDSDEHRQKATELGATDYIVKPFSLSNLESVVEKYCSSVVS